MKLIYLPLFPFWCYLTLKSRSFFFFNAANPLMRNGGMAMEPKNDIYGMIPQEHIPKTLYFKNGTPKVILLKACKEKGISFPCIIKPNMGMKGLGVSKIENERALATYLLKTTTDHIVQEYIDYPNEVGIFYVRHPYQTQGRITGIVGKEFLTVTGDGKHSVKELIEKHPRACLQIRRLQKIFGSSLYRVLPDMEKFTLVPIGSHTLGARFVDLSHHITPALTEQMNRICTAIPEFHYGRLDIKLTCLQDFSRGRNYSVIEVNGAGSEPTHMYDPKHSIFFAWKEICRHWSLLQQISQVNANKGSSYLSFREGLTMLKDNGQLEKQLRQVT